MQSNISEVLYAMCLASSRVVDLGKVARGHTVDEEDIRHGTKHYMLDMFSMSRRILSGAWIMINC